MEIGKVNNLAYENLNNETFCGAVVGANDVKLRQFFIHETVNVLLTFIGVVFVKTVSINRFFW